MILMLDVPYIEKENVVWEDSLKDLIKPYIKDVLKEPEFEEYLREKGMEVKD